MLRDQNLIPLSHQHQHALALCVRIDRAIQADDADLEVWQPEIQQIYEQEVANHFAAEEKELFPAAQRISFELSTLVAELSSEHTSLRGLFALAAARKMSANDLQNFAEKLSAHIRKEERQLFQAMQKMMPPEELTRLGKALDKALAVGPDACILPTPSTRLRPRTR
jgi:hemerythrin-like domain-containing protein